jgi:hypothetical protein
MKRFIWQFAVIVLSALRLSGQASLEFFTNQANALLQPAFGFGVTNIPIYSTANPSNAYSGSLHYLLQSAANGYDATTPATNSASVFRPLFGWSSNTLFIVGYTAVTTDFYAQIAQGFKVISDPTIGSNDNVWGIPWVVGMKNNPPAFNEYSYVTDVLAERELLFVRRSIGGQPATNLPPAYTNQIFILSVSNIFGLEAWNYSRSNFPDPVTIIISNEISILLTNNYDWGTNCQLSLSTNWIVNSWPGWTGSSSDGSFLVPLFTNVVPLPVSYWSESTEQFISINTTNPMDDVFLQSDLMQTGWPEHDWVLSITNNVMYGLIDNRTGQVLDFVNLGGLGNSIAIIEMLATQLGLSNGVDSSYAWITNGANDEFNSPLSSGVLNQIDAGEAEYPYFGLELEGRSNIPSPTFADPYVPANEIVQESTWQTIKPILHYTVDDLGVAQELYLSEFPEVFNIDYFPSIGTQISNSICTLGKINMYYHAPPLQSFSCNLQDGTFQLNFSGLNDLPYSIWASTNMLDWSQIGIASELNSQIPQDYLAMPFQFTDLTTSNYPARFYQIRQP